MRATSTSTPTGVREVRLVAFDDEARELSAGARRETVG